MQGWSRALPDRAAAPLTRRDVPLLADARLPPDPSGLSTILGQHQFEPSFPVIAGLLPCALPLLPGDHGGHDPAALPGIQTIAVTIERGLVGLVLLLHLPFAAEVRHPDRGAGWSCLLSRCARNRSGKRQRSSLRTEGLMPRRQDPFTLSTFEHAGLTQRQQHPTLL